MTEEETRLVEQRKDRTMFIARDKNNDLYLFVELPKRGAECWWAESGVDGTYLKMNKSLYPEVTWDSKPLPVRLELVSNT